MAASHLATSIATSAIRSGKRARFYSVVDLANQLEQEKKKGNSGRLSNRLKHVDLIISLRDKERRSRGRVV